MSAFQQDAARIAHVCMVARAALPKEPGERGRPPIDWYDDFTELLLEIANRGGVDPTLKKDRITGPCSGWLLDAAQALEAFLDWEIGGKRLSSHLMRSPSPEACGKRLERSLKRLRNDKRQNSPARRPIMSREIIAESSPCWTVKARLSGSWRRSAISSNGEPTAMTSQSSQFGSPTTQRSAALATVLLTPKEAAKVMKVSLSWLAKARMRGDGPSYIKLGRSIRYTEASLQQWMKSRQRLSTSEH